jgi:hypothetical protein
MTRRTLVLGTTVLLTVLPPALGTVAASARSTRSNSASNPALALHRAESRWHLGQMDKHRVTFRRLNRSVHRRFPFAAPFADRAIDATDVIHGGMEWGDLNFLHFHEGFAGR